MSKPLSVNDSSAPGKLTLGRWSRRGLVGASVLMMLALLATSWSGYQSVQEASSLLVRSLGDGFVRAVREVSRGRRGSAPEDLQLIVDTHAPDGLRYVAVMSMDGAVLAFAGTPSVTGAELVAAVTASPPNTVVTLGERVRFIAARVRPPHPPFDGRPGAPPRPPHVRDDPRRPGGRFIVVEYEPLLARELVASAMRTFAIGAAGALVLVLITLLLIRWLLRQELLEVELERGKRLASLGEMSAVLAHEIRNPLASLKGNAQLLQELLPEEHKARNKAERVVAEAVRLERLTNDLLEFVRSGRIDRRPNDPVALLRAAVDAVDDSRIEVHADGAPPTWSLDRARVGQVLTNLLRNAVQASPEEGRVDAFVSVADEHLVYTVRDRGDGLAPGEEQRIFEPFHTTRVRGTGLGLAVSRRLVESHGGTLTARNHPDGGAEMRVTIPAEQGA